MTKTSFVNLTRHSKKKNNPSGGITGTDGPGDLLGRTAESRAIKGYSRRRKGTNAILG